MPVSLLEIQKFGLPSSLKSLLWWECLRWISSFCVLLKLSDLSFQERLSNGISFCRIRCSNWSLSIFDALNVQIVNFLDNFLIFSFFRTLPHRKFSFLTNKFAFGSEVVGEPGRSWKNSKSESEFQPLNCLVKRFTGSEFIQNLSS